MVEPEKFFSPGYGPQNVEVTYPDNYLKHGDNPMFNLSREVIANGAKVIKPKEAFCMPALPISSSQLELDI